jgi:hypothetical protein
MAAAGVIALGEQEHVLAESRQVLAAQRAPIGGGLEVLSPADLPPARCRELGGHGIGGWHPRVAIVPAVEQRDERIIVETDRHRITGLLRLPVDGYRSRLTDYLNAAERAFLALTDVEVTSLQGTPRVEYREFLALSVSHIVLAMPADQDDNEPDHDDA